MPALALQAALGGDPAKIGFEAVHAAAKTAGVAMEDVDWFIPHQANQRILEGVARRLGIDSARVISTVAEHANTSAASIPLAMAAGLAQLRLLEEQDVFTKLEKLGAQLETETRAALHSDAAR